MYSQGEDIIVDKSQILKLKQENEALRSKLAPLGSLSRFLKTPHSASQPTVKKKEINIAATGARPKTRRVNLIKESDVIKALSLKKGGLKVSSVSDYIRSAQSTHRDMAEEKEFADEYDEYDFVQQFLKSNN